jgi:hypothetical protein
MAGETQNYHETRDPYFSSANFTAVAPIATSISMVPILRVPATNLAFPAGYWLKPGRRWLIRMCGAFTTAATPGNLTLEVRYQTGTPTDAGGTIICTSAATALAASKANITWEMEVWIESRGDPTTFVPTASPLGCYGRFLYDGAGALFTTTAQNPLLLPATTGITQTNVDCTLAGTIHIDAKRSGSTAESITVTDLAVNAMT